MSFEIIYQLSLGCTVLYLIFICWVFTAKSILGFIVIKIIPFVLAAIITFHILIESGYIIKVG
jgi:hypothetical protein